MPFCFWHFGATMISILDKLDKSIENIQLFIGPFHKDRHLNNIWVIIGAVVVVGKWSACLPSNWTVQFQITPKLTVFMYHLSVKRTQLNKKRPGLAHLKTFAWTVVNAMAYTARSISSTLACTSYCDLFFNPSFLVIRCLIMRHTTSKIWKVTPGKLCLFWGNIFHTFDYTVLMVRLHSTESTFDDRNRLTNCT